MFRHLLMRLKFRWLLNRQRSMPLSVYLPLWKASDGVYAGPVGFGARLFPEARALQKVAADSTIRDEELHALLVHQDPKIAMYCLEALARRHSPLLSDIPATVAARRDKFWYRLACFAHELSVEEWVTFRASKKTA